jgi:hypothetical protein
LAKARFHQAIGRQLEAFLLVDRTSLVDGWVVMQLESESLGEAWFHIALLFIKPIRPTLLKMQRQVQDGSNDLDDSRPQTEQQLTTSIGADGAAEWQTLYQAIDGLDLSIGWLCRLWRLANSTPQRFNPSSVQVTALAAPPCVIWDPAAGGEADVMEAEACLPNLPHTQARIC